MMPKQKKVLVVVFLLAIVLVPLLFGAFFEGVSLVVGRKNDAALEGLVINEVMADNDITLAGPQGTFPDWIELYNAGNESVKLSGMYLTNDLSNAKAWRFPKGVSIESDSYLVIWADNGADGTDELHASFALGANMGVLGFFDSDGKTLIDAVVLDKQLRDVSYGRMPDGGSDWQYLTISTPNAANQANSSGQTPVSVWLMATIAVIVVVIIAAFLIAGKLTLKRRKLDAAQ